MQLGKETIENKSKTVTSTPMYTKESGKDRGKESTKSTRTRPRPKNKPERPIKYMPETNNVTRDEQRASNGLGWRIMRIIDNDSA